MRVFRAYWGVMLQVAKRGGVDGQHSVVLTGEPQLIVLTHCPQAVMCFEKEGQGFDSLYHKNIHSVCKDYLLYFFFPLSSVFFTPVKLL